MDTDNNLVCTYCGKPFRNRKSLFLYIENCCITCKKTWFKKSYAYTPIQQLQFGKIYWNTANIDFGTPDVRILCSICNTPDYVGYSTLQKQLGACNRCSKIVKEKKLVTINLIRKELYKLKLKKPSYIKEGYNVLRYSHLSTEDKALLDKCYMKKRKYEITEHRLVILRQIQRPFEPNEVIHHINENKLDNRPENLQLCTTTEHTAIHIFILKREIARLKKILQEHNIDF